MIFFSKCATFYVDFKNAMKIIKGSFVFKIIVLELVAGICLKSDEKRCDRLSEC